MKTEAVVAYLFLATAVVAEPDDLVLQIFSWDGKSAKTISGWFTDSKKIGVIEKGISDSVPTRKAIEVARTYLSKTFPELGDDADPFLGETVPKKEKVKSWAFVEMSIHPIDLGRGRGTLISWKAEESGLFYYVLKFRPEFEGRSPGQQRTVVLLPNLEVVPYRTISATKSEREQIVWWERHVGNHEFEDKEALIRSETK